ncbi:AP2 domain-containing protein [Cytobacillus oceanisediminis]|uniref:AP2 domain-containing protein n=1 Tax=Cytobacillus oceanisediminis TaxID=665099 RepID=A0ABX3CLA2_9BACI|nr:AP2 domain-containing protein [Cytobacillus oceanisediminis]OHX43429.1 hypothetical protein BBV17_26330 [Cytobacillus oceanisediminis]
MEENLVGRKFGYLNVIALNNEHRLGNSWLCACQCGKEIVLSTIHLIGSKNRRPYKSCGCKQKSRKGKTMKYPDLYAKWADIIDRCYNPDRQNYSRFGAKGITVCEEWRNSFEIFLEWNLANGYDTDLRFSRKDKTKPYEPDNCHWVSIFDQHTNKSKMSNNKSGYTGVCSHGENKYRAYISRKGKRKYLGLFDTIDEAAKARKEAEEYYEKHGIL